MCVVFIKIILNHPNHRPSITRLSIPGVETPGYWLKHPKSRKHTESSYQAPIKSRSVIPVIVPGVETPTSSHPNLITPGVETPGYWLKCPETPIRHGEPNT